MLENVELFSGLSKQELETMELFCQERKFLKWETIFSKWEEATAMYILKDWLLEVVDEYKVLWHIERWWIVWEMAIFAEPKVRSASVIALQDSELIVILSFSIQDLTKKYPEVSKKIEQIILERREKNSWK